MTAVAARSTSMTGACAEANAPKKYTAPKVLALEHCCRRIALKSIPTRYTALGLQHVQGMKTSA